MDKQLPPTKHKLKTGNHNIQTNYQFKVEKYQRKNMEKNSEILLSSCWVGHLLLGVRPTIQCGLYTLRETNFSFASCC